MSLPLIRLALYIISVAFFFFINALTLVPHFLFQLIGTLARSYILTEIWHLDPVSFFLLNSKRMPGNPGGHVNGITSRLATKSPVSKTEDV